MCFTGIAAQCRESQFAQFGVSKEGKFRKNVAVRQVETKAGPEAAALSASRRESAQQANDIFELRSFPIAKVFLFPNLHEFH